MKKLKRIICKFTGHRYRIRQVFSTTQRRVVCGRCGGDWGMHDGVKAFVPWDADLADLYSVGHVAVNVNIIGLDTSAATNVFQSHQRRFR